MRSLLQILALSILSLPLVVSGTPIPDSDSEAAPATAPMGLQGFDISRRRNFIDWAKAKADGIRFVYIEASRGSKVEHEPTRSHV